jgi:hypothetical protein
MSIHDDNTADPHADPQSGHGVTRRTVLGALATGAVMLSQPGVDAAAGEGEASELAALDQMAAKPTTLGISRWAHVPDRNRPVPHRHRSRL